MKQLPIFDIATELERACEDDTLDHVAMCAYMLNQIITYTEFSSYNVQKLTL